MKKTALAAIALTSLAIAPLTAEARHQKYGTDQLIAMGVHPTIARSFEALNVPVIDGTTLPQICSNPDPDLKIRAIYNFKMNVVVACIQNMDNNRQFVTSVTHEAVHMVQDCRTGLASYTLDAGSSKYISTLWRALPHYLRDNIIEAYDAKDWEYETEAFFFQSRPDKVANGIRHFCF